MQEFLSNVGLVALALMFLALALGVVGVVVWLPGAAAAVLVKRAMPAVSERRRVVLAIRLVAMAVPAVFVGWMAFTSLYPDADFYLGEYRAVTLREPPISAHVEKRNASYPDMHGNYCSQARVALAPADYQSLLGELLADHRMQQLTHDESPLRPMRQGTDAPSDARWVFSRDLESEPGSHRFITFGKDGTHVDIERCEV